MDLSGMEIAEIPTMDYAGRFIGGRGISARIYWDDMPWGIGAFDPENKTNIYDRTLSRDTCT